MPSICRVLDRVAVDVVNVHRYRARYSSRVRIALVSPYSWTYPGGVTRHIEALSVELAAQGHEPRILAPFDPDDALSRHLHRGARPQQVEPPENFLALGRTIGVPANGAVSNLTGSLAAVLALRRELRTGGYDVAHIHEPIVPLIGFDALMSTGELPLVGTFHTYSTNQISNEIGAIAFGGRWRMNRLHARIAVSEAAAWTARRFYGGHYRIVPNGVILPAASGSHSVGECCDAAQTAHARVPGEGLGDGESEQPLRILFIGQSVERKGLPVLLRAFEALREHVSRDAHARGRERRGDRADAARRPWRACTGEGQRGAKERRAGVVRRCCARLRCTGRALAWCSPRRSPQARRWSRRISPAIATSRATASTVCSSRPAMRWRSPRRCVRWRLTPCGARAWRWPHASAPSASPGRMSPRRWLTSTSRRSPSGNPRREWRVSPYAWVSHPPTCARLCVRDACRASSPRRRSAIARCACSRGSHCLPPRWPASRLPTSRCGRSASRTSPRASSPPAPGSWRRASG